MFSAVDGFFADAIRYGVVQAVRLAWRKFHSGNLAKVLRAHREYTRYVIRHKLFVYRAGRKLGLGRWQLLVHDLSKFGRAEWYPYVWSFYLKPQKPKNDVGYYHSVDVGDDLFNRAWLHHQKVNPHHWQYWVLIQDDDPTLALEMPRKFALEMVADWQGAGAAQGYGDDVLPWYTKHRDKMVLHPETRMLVERLIGYSN